MADAEARRAAKLARRAARAAAAETAAAAEPDAAQTIAAASEAGTSAGAPDTRTAGGASDTLAASAGGAADTLAASAGDAADTLNAASAGGATDTPAASAGGAADTPAASMLQPASADDPTRPRPIHMGSKAVLKALLMQMYGCGRKPDRDLTFVETFAGDAAVSRGMRLLGFAGEALDMRRSASHDILTPVGFLVTLAAAMRIRRGGVFWAAPPCSTWVFLSRGSTGQNKSPSGNWKASPYVASQNALVCRLLLLARLRIARQVYYIIEQPRSSCMFEYGPFAAFLERHPASSIFTEMGAFGMMAEKDMVLVGTAPYLPMLTRRLSSDQRKELRQNSERKQTTKVSVRADGRKNVQGGRDLKSTQAYPIGFGCAHARCFKTHDDSAMAEDVPQAAADPVRAAAADEPPAKRSHVRPPPAAADSDTDADSAATVDEDVPTAAAAVGPNAFLPAHDAGSHALTFLDDMSDDENPWYLDDLRTWNPARWHDNSAEENRLKLT